MYIPVIIIIIIIMANIRKFSDSLEITAGE